LAFHNVLVETVKLVETTLKKLDAQGRVAIPAAWRRGWKSGKVILIKRGEKIELSPIELVSPSSLFDSIEISDNVDFTDSHSLRRALLERTTH
jgi:bifunctional DNA-binding transcriptional regulator/antitoxin component of YhaV-PrlF toxin-antitoxin module